MDLPLIFLGKKYLEKEFKLFLLNLSKYNFQKYISNECITKIPEIKLKTQYANDCRKNW